MTPIGSIFDARLVVLTFVGKRQPLPGTLKLTEALRGALLKACPHPSPNGPPATTPTAVRLTVHTSPCYQLQVPYSDPRELLMDICEYGPEVEVLAPAELRTAVAARVRASAALYRDA